jgi:hypothetical protein
MRYDLLHRAGNVQGMNDWRNIQDIVRVTFKAFHDVLKAQGDAIKSLERIVDAKANRKEVSAALAAKASATEVCRQMKDIEHQLCHKADVEVCIGMLWVMSQSVVSSGSQVATAASLRRM